jgi:hypothetical protein
LTSDHYLLLATAPGTFADLDITAVAVESVVTEVDTIDRDRAAFVKRYLKLN